MRRHSGRTPTDFVNEARMRFAARRPLESRAKVVDVALARGFESRGHVYRLFDRAHGQPPHTFRKQRQATLLGR